MSGTGIGGIVLAAGASNRLGRPKQLLQWKGELLVNRALRLAAKAGLDPIVLVLGANAEKIKPLVEGAGVHIIHAQGWHEGMAASLRTGIHALQERAPDIGAAMLMVVDQPALESRHLSQLMALWAQRDLDMLYSEYAHGSGVPAIIGSHLFPRLLGLKGDRGAKAILARNPGLSTAVVPFPQGHLDVDHPGDWARWQESGKSSD